MRTSSGAVAPQGRTRPGVCLCRRWRAVPFVDDDPRGTVAAYTHARTDEPGALVAARCSFTYLKSTCSPHERATLTLRCRSYAMCTCWRRRVTAPVRSVCATVVGSVCVCVWVINKICAHTHAHRRERNSLGVMSGKLALASLLRRRGRRRRRHRLQWGVYQ